MSDKLRIEISPLKFKGHFIGSLRIFWDKKDVEQFYIKDVLGRPFTGMTIYETSEKTEACQFLNSDFERLFSDLSVVQMRGPEEWWEDHRIVLVSGNKPKNKKKA